MENVRGEEFYHYQPVPVPYWGGVRATPWQVGQTYTVGAEFNLYFDFFNEKGWGWASPGGPFHPSVWFAEHVLNVLDGREPPHPDIDGFYSYDVLETLRRTTWSLKKEADLVRELVFEEMRREHFADHPSRQRCIWVAPSKEAARFWQTRTPGRKRWFRVRLSGVIHRTSSEYVVADTISLKELRAFAEQYWSGTPGTEPFKDEVLFEGVVEVVADVSPEELGMA